MARIALVHDVAGVAAIQAELLRRAGHQVDQISLPAYGAGWRWPAKAVAMPLRLAAYLPVIAKLRGTDYDVIHIHWLSHGIVGVLARRPFFATTRHPLDAGFDSSSSVPARTGTRSVRA